MTDIPQALIPEGVPRAPGAPPSPVKQQSSNGGGGGKRLSGTLLRELQDAAGRQREEQYLELDVPGVFAGKLRIRYHGLSLDELDRYADLLEHGRTSSTSMNVDAMTRCCDAVLAKDGEAWEVVEDDDGPVGLEHRLGQLLGMPAPAAGADLSDYEVVTNLFVIGKNAMPLQVHAGRLGEWLSGTEGLEPGKSLAGSGSPRSAVLPPSASART